MAVSKDAEGTHLHRDGRVIVCYRSAENKLIEYATKNNACGSEVLSSSVLNTTIWLGDAKHPNPSCNQYSLNYCDLSRRVHSLVRG